MDYNWDMECAADLYSTTYVVCRIGHATPLLLISEAKKLSLPKMIAPFTKQ